MKILTDWQHNWYGMWSFGLASRAQYPSVQEAIDLEWTPSDKDRLLAYLDNCVLVDVVGMNGRCELCGCEIPLGDRSDGEWIWEMNLTHLMREHAVVIPNRLSDHIRQRNYIPSIHLKVAIEDLPWPDGYAIKNRRRVIE